MFDPFASDDENDDKTKKQNRDQPLHNFELSADNRATAAPTFDLGIDPDDEEYDAHQLFLEEQEDLQFLHQDAIKSQRKRDFLSKLLILSNTLMALLLIVFIALFVMMVQRSRAIKPTPSPSPSPSPSPPPPVPQPIWKLAQIASCPLLDQYYAENSRSVSGRAQQPYFNASFLSDMHSSIRQQFITRSKSNHKSLKDTNVRVHFEGQKQDLFDVRAVPFRQSRPFLYLTGVDRPNCDVVIDLATGETTLFVPGVSASVATWIDNTEETLEEITALYGVNSTRYQSEMNEFLMIDGDSRETYKITADLQVLEMKRENQTIGYVANNSTSFLSTIKCMRDTKTESEIKIMKKVHEVSSHAHIQTMKQISNGTLEYQASAYFELFCQHCGMRTQAFAPIVASGKNAAVLHYTEKRDVLEKGQLIIVDAGAEFLGYASDITRTYPVDGQFNSMQALLYNSVLEIQEQTIKLVKPNANFTDIKNSASEFLIEQLRKLQVINAGSVEDALKLDIHKVFQPHGIGHLVGLDVHDTTVYPTTILKNGMFVTIEPGIYFNEYQLARLSSDQKAMINSTRITEFLAAQATGVRIEDEILVTSTGTELLSIAPKTIKAIQDLMRSGPQH